MPVLEILTQPVEHHRPRYESEISTNKIGGLLLGRGSTGKDNRAFIKLKISGIDPAVHRELQLFVCVASQNGELHPYYLHGDGCRDGCFFWVKQVDYRTPSEIEIKFERLAVIRCKTSSDAIQEALKKREEQVQGYFSPTV
ncbi:hypothetical protein BOX15_Mlig033322g1 [Macrostomum lignano]|uniref:RHD domain-containing protein n=1 Tax=Macrostomum lignano TaxID=282301 RepID=A0A267F705_9PLAT|nr:hypothetical protein BOX15_Mlig033322g1 [Macrostomum lignano]